MLFKKIVSIFLTAALFVSMLPVFGSAENTEIFKVGVEAMTAASTVSASPIIYNPGEEITVEIRASQNTGITSLSLVIEYNEAVLEPVVAKCSATNLFTANDSLTAKNGYFMFYSENYPKVSDATGTFAKITFVVKDTCAADQAIAVRLRTNGSCGKYTNTGLVTVPFAAEANTFAVHKITKEAGVVTLPTCTVKGYTTYTCESCKESVTGNIVPENGHTPAEAVVENTVAPTCTVDGSFDSVVYCAVETCKTELSREKKVIPALGHNPAEAVVENRVEPTCTEDGKYDSVVYCGREDCKTELTRETIVLPKLGHTPAEAVVENRVEPTCTVTGKYDSVVYCAVESCKCELSREQFSIPMLGHTAGEPVVENRVEPTCTVSGSYDSVVYCKTCNAELSREKISIPMLDHAPAEAVIENRVEPTCTKEGSFETVIYCKDCKAELSRVKEAIEMLPHNLEKHDAQEATHTQIGWEAYETCKDCDFTTYVEIPMVPYKPGDLTGDEEITDADALYLLYAIFDAENYPLNQDADYNSDGVVTDADAVYLLYAIFDAENYPLRKEV